MVVRTRRASKAGETSSSAVVGTKHPSQQVLLLFAGALLVRLLMLLLGTWMDTQQGPSSVKYTDVDYLVFSDAAHFLAQGGSPYERDTYRYTPFLAYLLLPNLWLHPAWGKVVFVAADLWVGHLIMRISEWTSLRASSSNITTTSASSSMSASSPLVHAALWLFNPLVINFSTRGSADALVSALVLATVLYVLQRRTILAGVFHGMAVHFKLYPIVFSFSYLAAFLQEEEEDTTRKTTKKSSSSTWKEWWQRLGITKDRVVFTLVSASTFFASTGAAYWLHGDEFLQEGLLYHLTRTDNRHNFSPWFYAIYLDFENEARRRWLGLVAFLPQVLLLAATSFVLGPRDLPFCIAIQTMAFVAFNKVCTAQYFAWYFSVLPAAAPTLLLLPSPGWTPFVLGGAWVAALGMWLFNAYQLEFVGQNTFFATWLASLAFLAVNVGVLVWLVDGWGKAQQTKRLGQLESSRTKKHA